MSRFSEDIIEFNGMYKLPVANKPSLTEVGDAVSRLRDFKKILAEELEEIEDVIHLIENSSSASTSLTALADLLGDIQVYCASEMAKFGLPLDQTLAIIMNSNFSKLGKDGLPIYDERGKVLKGPNYWKPEPAITEMIKDLM